MNKGNEISVLNIIITLFIFFRGLKTGVHEVGAINYCIVRGIIKANIIFLALIIFLVLIDTLPVKYPGTITNIARGALLVILVVVIHGGR